jgi:cation transport ATPase
MVKLNQVSLVLLLVLAGTTHAAQSLKAKVNGMVCAFCAQGIEKKLRALSQTKDVYVNLKSKVVAVELKDGQAFSPEALTSLIKDAGYDVVAVESVNQSAQEIKVEIGKR